MVAARRHSIGPLRRTAAAAALLAAGVVTGCTGDSDSSPDSDSATDSAQPGEGGTVSELSLAAEPAEQQTRIRRVWGRWPAVDNSARTQHLARAIGRAVGSWVDGAFVAADYPTRDFNRAFSTFTRGAAVQARRDLWLTTNRTLGRRVVDAVPVQRTVRVFAFAPNGRAVGATAEVRLSLRLMGQSGRRSTLTVTGQLSLTRDAGRWRIFGYELQRSVR